MSGSLPRSCPPWNSISMSWPAPRSGGRLRVVATASETADAEAVPESPPPLTRPRPLSMSFRPGDSLALTGGQGRGKPGRGCLPGSQSLSQLRGRCVSCLVLPLPADSRAAISPVFMRPSYESLTLHHRKHQGPQGVTRALGGLRTLLVQAGATLGAIPRWHQRGREPGHRVLEARLGEVGIPVRTVRPGDGG